MHFLSFTVNCTRVHPVTLNLLSLSRPHLLDSMIDRLWPERMTVVDALVAPTPAMSLFYRLALGVERARRAVRRWAKRMAASGWKRRPARPPGGA